MTGSEGTPNTYDEVFALSTTEFARRSRQLRRALIRSWQKRLARDGDKGYLSVHARPVIVQGRAHLHGVAPLPFRHRNRGWSRRG